MWLFVLFVARTQVVRNHSFASHEKHEETRKKSQHHDRKFGHGRFRLSLYSNTRPWIRTKLTQVLCGLFGICRTAQAATEREDDETSAIDVRASVDVSADIREQATTHICCNAAQYDVATHGCSSLDLSRKDAQGAWHLGDSASAAPEDHSDKQAGSTSCESC